MSKRSRSRRSQTKKLYASLISGLVLALLAVIGIKFFGPSITSKVAVADTQETSQSTSSSSSSSAQVEVALLSAKIEKTQPSSTSSQSSSETPEPTASETEIETPAEPTVEAEQVASEEPVVEEYVVETEYVATEVIETATPAASTGYPTVLANGNSAGAIGAEAAARMAAATGVPQETWEYIIARESNGDPNVANASGASGLFQTMPGWGSTATVDDQINAALNAYNNQGLAAWSMP